MRGSMARWAATVVVMIGLIATTAGAEASTRSVVRSGSCSGASHRTLKLKPDNGRIEVEFEVDQNVVGVPWRVRLLDDGHLVGKGLRTTRAPSGSFTFRRVVADRPGRDSFVARSRSLRSAETCVGRASI
jgi:hypothetical protein